MTTPMRVKTQIRLTVKSFDLQFIKQPPVVDPTGLGASKMDKDQQAQ